MSPLSFLSLVRKNGSLHETILKEGNKKVPPFMEQVSAQVQAYCESNRLLPSLLQLLGDNGTADQLSQIPSLLVASTHAPRTSNRSKHVDRLARNAFPWTVFVTVVLSLYRSKVTKADKRCSSERF
jgi:hypothetical protein